MKIVKKVGAVIIFNLLLVTFAVSAGYQKGDIYYYFQEKEMVTFLSALLLGLTSLCAVTSSFIRKKTALMKTRMDFWLISAIGFFYLSIDEYFMLHEGMDTPLVKVFGYDPQIVHWDGFVFVILWIVGGIIALKCWKEIITSKDFVVICGLASICLFGMIVFDFLDQNNPLIKVIEEGFKITGVTFFFTAYFSTMLMQIEQAVIMSSQK